MPFIAGSLPAVAADEIGRDARQRRLRNVFGRRSGWVSQESRVYEGAPRRRIPRRPIDVQKLPNLDMLIWRSSGRSATGLGPLTHSCPMFARGIFTLIAVRRSSGSRHDPQFNRPLVRTTLEEIGIAYPRAVEVGARLVGERGEDAFGCVPVAAFRSYSARIGTERRRVARRTSRSFRHLLSPPRSGSTGRRRPADAG
jgi:hypothetical protein